MSARERSGGWRWTPRKVVAAGVVILCLCQLALQVSLDAPVREAVPEPSPISWEARELELLQRVASRQALLRTGELEEGERREAPVGYKHVCDKMPVAAAAYEFDSILKECKFRSENQGFIEQSLKSRRSSPLSLEQFVCQARCSGRDAELERVFRVLRIERYGLKGMLTLCKRKVFPFLVKIKSNQVWVHKCDPKPSGKRAFMSSMKLLNTVASLVTLPDVIFGFDGNDYATPQKKSPIKYTLESYSHPLPNMMRLVGIDSHAVPLFPTPEAVQGFGLKARGDFFYVEDKPDSSGLLPEWDTRSDDIIWRGGSTGMPFDVDYMYMAPRLALARATFQRPGFDVAVTTSDGVSKEMVASGLKDSIRIGGEYRVNFKDFARHRYVLHVDGNTASWGLRRKLNLESTILWIESQARYREHYYHLLKPWEHFIPINPDLSNLYQVREWLSTQAGQIEAKLVRDNLQKLVQTQLRPEDLVCYVTRLVYSMARNQGFDPNHDLESLVDFTLWRDITF